MSRARQRVSGRWRAGALALTGLALSACVSVFPNDTAPMQRYRLSAPDAPAPGAAPVDWQLIVEAPTAARALDTQRIALTRSAQMYEYYADVEWAERAPRLVQSLLVQGFENSGKIVAVSRRAVGVRADLALVSDLRRFEVDYPNRTPVARVGVYLKIVRQPSGAIAAARLIEAEAPAARDSADAVALAFEEAAQAAVQDAVSWTLQEGERILSAFESGGGRSAPASPERGAQPSGLDGV